MAVGLIAAATAMPSTQNKYNRIQAKIWNPLKRFDICTPVSHTARSVRVRVRSIYSLHSISRKYMIIFCGCIGITRYAYGVAVAQYCQPVHKNQTKRTTKQQREKNPPLIDSMKCMYGVRKSQYISMLYAVCITYTLLMGYSTENQTNYNITNAAAAAVFFSPCAFAKSCHHI